MKMQKEMAFIVFLLGALSFGAGGSGEETMALSLEESILRALKNNLAVAVQILNADKENASMAMAREKFMPSLSLHFNKRKTFSAAYSWLDAAESVKAKTNELTFQINQIIPGGGSVGLSLDASKNDSDRNFQTINPRYNSALTLSLAQPLLRNFGWNISRREILIAGNNLDISKSELEEKLMETVKAVEDAYWNLVYGINNLEVRRQSLSLAQDLLEKNKRSVEVGTLAPIEILSAQAEVATREADILQAEAQVKISEDELRMILNISPEEEKRYASIVPSDGPRLQSVQMTLDEAVAAAEENRPDLRAARLGLKNEDLNLDFARNQILPNLDLTASYWSPGVSGDQLIYLNNNPLSGVILDRIPGGSSAALKDAFDFKYKNWSVGLTLTLPVSNVFSRALYTQAKIQKDQAALALKNQERQIFLEIKNSLRAVETDSKRIQAYKVARELAEQKLSAEEEKLKVGLSTNYLVLQYQRDLATARSAELKAIVDYNISLARLDRVLGTSLKNKNIALSDFSKLE